MIEEQNPTVAVIMPNRNGADFISESIDSVLSQTYSHWILYVIDDSSSDSSCLLVESYSRRFPHKVKLLRNKENLGPGGSRNVGILNSKSEYIAFLDSDDIWNPDKLELQVQQLNSDESIILTYCSGLEFLSNTNQIIGAMPAKFRGNCHYLFHKYPTKAIISLGGSGALFRRSVLSVVGPFDERFCSSAEDWDFFRRISLCGTVDFISKNLILYRRHQNNLSRANTIQYFNSNRNAVMKMIRDEDLPRSKSLPIAWRFHLSYLRHFIKFCNYLGVVELFKSCSSWGKSVREFERTKFR